MDTDAGDHVLDRSRSDAESRWTKVWSQSGHLDCGLCLAQDVDGGKNVAGRGRDRNGDQGESIGPTSRCGVLMYVCIDGTADIVGTGYTSRHVTAPPRRRDPVRPRCRF